MRRRIVVGVALSGLVLAVLGACSQLIQVMPNKCDAGNQRLHALERDPAAQIELPGANVTKRVSIPASSMSIKGCNSAAYEIDYSTSDPNASYSQLKAELQARGWRVGSEGPTVDGRPFSSYDKTIDGWMATLDMGPDLTPNQLSMVLRAPPDSP